MPRNVRKTERGEPERGQTNTKRSREERRKTGERQGGHIDAHQPSDNRKYIYGTGFSQWISF